MSRSWFAGRVPPAGILAVALLAPDASVMGDGLQAAEAENERGTARLALAAHRYALLRAIRGAADQLSDERCHALLDEFADGSGQSLRSVLAASGLTISDYLTRVFFYDAPEWACRGGNLAVTRPGSRAVFVCGARFQREMSRNRPNAEASVIHELLHSLGLGENPPSSDQITARVRARCGRGGGAKADKPARRSGE